jgi:hypothetical protein
MHGHQQESGGRKPDISPPQTLKQSNLKKKRKKYTKLKQQKIKLLLRVASSLF